jgi:hypothetical protein
MLPRAPVHSTAACLQGGCDYVTQVTCVVDQVTQCADVALITPLLPPLTPAEQQAVFTQIGNCPRKSRPLTVPPQREGHWCLVGRRVPAAFRCACPGLHLQIHYSWIASIPHCSSKPDGPGSRYPGSLHAWLAQLQSPIQTFKAHLYPPSLPPLPGYGM